MDESYERGSMDMIEVLVWRLFDGSMRNAPKFELALRAETYVSRRLPGNLTLWIENRVHGGQSIIG